MLANINSEYLALAAILTAINKRYGLISQNEIMIMDLVAKENLSNRLPCVFDVMLLDHIASQATIHSVLKTLIKKKLLSTKIDCKDNRRKFVSLTPLGLKRLQECDLAVKRVRANQKI